MGWNCGPELRAGVACWTTIGLVSIWGGFDLGGWVGGNWTIDDFFDFSEIRFLLNRARVASLHWLHSSVGGKK